MHLLKVVALFVVVSLLAGGLTAIAVTLDTYHNVLVYGMNITIVDGAHAGLNTRNDMLYFGKVSRGGGSTRQILVKNYLSVPTKLHFQPDESFPAQIIAYDEGYIMKSGEERVFNIDAVVLSDAPPGSYIGELTIFFKKI